MIKLILVGIIACTVSGAQAATQVLYSDQFSAYYPEVNHASAAFKSGTPLEKPVTELSPLKILKAIFTRTDGTKIPYEKSTGFITIESGAGEKQVIFLKRFRTVELKWINERHLHIVCDIGHSAAIDSIFDALDGKWIFRKSVIFGAGTTPSATTAPGLDCPAGTRESTGMNGPRCCPDGALCD